MESHIFKVKQNGTGQLITVWIHFFEDSILDVVLSDTILLFDPVDDGTWLIFSLVAGRSHLFCQSGAVGKKKGILFVQLSASACRAPGEADDKDQRGGDTASPMSVWSSYTGKTRGSLWTRRPNSVLLLNTLNTLLLCVYRGVGRPWVKRGTELQPVSTSFTRSVNETSSLTFM